MKNMKDFFPAVGKPQLLNSLKRKNTIIFLFAFFFLKEFWQIGFIFSNINYANGDFFRSD